MFSVSTFGRDRVHSGFVQTNGFSGSDLSVSFTSGFSSFSRRSSLHSPPSMYIAMTALRILIQAVCLKSSENSN